MKKLIFVFLIAALFSCDNSFTCDEPDPKPPYGTPDDYSVYNGSDGYRSITYTYFCRNGQYIAVTYTRDDACSTFLRDDFTTSGICK